MSNPPNLSLGEPPGKLARKAKSSVSGWVYVVAVLQIATLALLAVLWLRPNSPSVVSTSSNGTGPSDWKAIATELQNRSLDGQAAEAWQAYLDSVQDTDERPEILYRIGTLHLQAEQYDRAAAAFVSCQQFSEGQGDLAKKAGQKLVDCLRNLGMYGEVGRELSRQVEQGADEPGRGKALARFAGEELTEADLDRMIEQRVDQMLAMQGAAADESARETILRQFATPSMRQQIFQELLQTELFTRRARELGLDKSPEYRDAIRSLQQNLLADRFQRNELAKIQPTDVDIQSYYQANRQKYLEPTTLEVKAIELNNAEESASVLDQIKSADDFRRLAGERKKSTNVEGSTNAEESVAAAFQLAQGQRHPVLGDVDALFELNEGDWTKEAIKAGEKSYLLLVEEKQTGRIPPLSDVKFRVQSDYVQTKQRELSENIMRDLMTRYQVEIMELPPPSSSNHGELSPEPGEQK